MLELWLEMLQLPSSAPRSSVGAESGKGLDTVSFRATNSNSEPAEAKAGAILVLVRIMRDIESCYLKIAEMRTLRSAISEFISFHGLGDEKELYRTLQSRFSLDYLPGVSQLGLHRFSGLREQIPAAALPSLPSPMPSAAPKPISTSSQCYMMCSIRRQQQALWTTYRLYLDGTRDLADGAALSSEPVCLLAAKTLKSGMSSTCLVWGSGDARQWKEKSAVGRITRGGPGTGTTYLGIPSEDSSNDCGGPIAVSVQRRGMEKLLYLTAALHKDGSSTSSEVELSTLEATLRSPDLSSIQSQNLCVLRSKLPRKVSVGSPASGTTVLTIAFGRDTRVRAASRKNLAMDNVVASNDWAPESEHPPVLTVGKMAEDQFAVDFYGIKPFQAFTIALAAFDR